jgi:hypothetical protein
MARSKSRSALRKAVDAHRSADPGARVGATGPPVSSGGDDTGQLTHGRIGSAMRLRDKAHEEIRDDTATGCAPGPAGGDLVGRCAGRSTTAGFARRAPSTPCRTSPSRSGGWPGRPVRAQTARTRLVLQPPVCPSEDGRRAADEPAVERRCEQELAVGDYGEGHQPAEWQERNGQCRRPRTSPPPGG